DNSLAEVSAVRDSFIVLRWQASWEQSSCFLHRRKNVWAGDDARALMRILRCSGPPAWQESAAWLAACPPTAPCAASSPRAFGKIDHEIHDKAGASCERQREKK